MHVDFFLQITLGKIGCFSAQILLKVWKQGTEELYLETWIDLSSAMKFNWPRYDGSISESWDIFLQL